MAIKFIFPFFFVKHPAQLFSIKIPSNNSSLIINQSEFRTMRFTRSKDICIQMFKYVPGGMRKGERERKLITICHFLFRPRYVFSPHLHPGYFIYVGYDIWIIGDCDWATSYYYVVNRNKYIGYVIIFTKRNDNRNCRLHLRYILFIYYVWIRHMGYWQMGNVIYPLNMIIL